MPSALFNQSASNMMVFNIANPIVRPDEGTSVHSIPKASFIEFHTFQSNLVKNKGKPVLDMIPDFKTVENDPQWEIKQPSNL